MVKNIARYGNTSDSPDEYWALDNVQVTQIGGPGTGLASNVATVNIVVSPTNDAPTTSADRATRRLCVSD